MKELSIEQKAIAYDEAIKRAKEINNEQRAQPFDVMTKVFPELKESEDENIRKEIISFIQDQIDEINLQVSGDYDTRDKQDLAFQEWCKKALAWLEKQGEHANFRNKIQVGDKVTRNEAGILVNISQLERIAKPRKVKHTDKVEPKFKVKYAGSEYNVLEIKESAGVTYYGIEDEPNHIDYVKAENCDIINGYAIKENGSPYPTKPAVFSEQKTTDKVVPKFKVGDWIVNDYCFGKVIEITNDAYLLDTGQGIPFSCEHNVHLWTIQDAKDGDVLASELCDSIILFRGIKDDNIDFYCDYDFSKIDIPGDRFTVNNGQHYGNVEDSKDFYPATKEQRDTLFSKMHEAGYEWNAEKKELKKIEQKPQRMVSAEAKEALYDEPTDEEMKELLRTEYEKGRADTIAEMKSSWSEEDDEIINGITSYLCTHDSCELDGFNKWYDWLKSLKQRIGG